MHVCILWLQLWFCFFLVTYVQLYTTVFLLMKMKMMKMFDIFVDVMKAKLPVNELST